MCLYSKPLSAFQAWWDMLGNFLVYVSLSSQNMFCVFSTASTLPHGFLLIVFSRFLYNFSTAIAKLSTRKSMRRSLFLFSQECCVRWRTTRQEKRNKRSRKWRGFCVWVHWVLCAFIHCLKHQKAPLSVYFIVTTAIVKFLMCNCVIFDPFFR